LNKSKSYHKNVVWMLFFHLKTRNYWQITVFWIIIPCFCEFIVKAVLSNFFRILISLHYWTILYTGLFFYIWGSLNYIRCSLCRLKKRPHDDESIISIVQISTSECISLFVGKFELKISTKGIVSADHWRFFRRKYLSWE
jgi:hypothetical protein